MDLDIDNIIDEGLGSIPGGKLFGKISGLANIAGSKLDNLFFREYRDPVYNFLRSKGYNEQSDWGPIAVKWKISHDDVKQGKDHAYYVAAWNRLFSFIEEWLNKKIEGTGNQFRYLNNKYGNSRSDGPENYWKGAPVQALQETLSNPQPMGSQSNDLFDNAIGSGSGDSWFGDLGNAFNTNDPTDWAELFGLKKKGKFTWLWWVFGGLAVLIFLIWLIRLIFKK